MNAGVRAGIPVQGVNDTHYVWDYGTVVPLRYLVPKEDIPVINLSVTSAANLEETYKWGQVISETLEESDKKVVFVASGALSHNLVRGLQHLPTILEQAMNRQFMDFLMRKDYEVAFDMLEQYANLAKVESGGRHLAMLLAILEPGSEPAILAESQSFASWNAVCTFGKNMNSSYLAGVTNEFAK